MINIVCCLWGDWPEEGWGQEYVRRLYRGVRRNYHKPFQFTCFSDRASYDEWVNGITYKPLRAPSWMGCLPKTYVYSPQAHLTGRVLLFDLDNVITGPIDALANYSGPLAVRGKFRGQMIPDGDMLAFEAGSPTAQLLWERIVSDPTAVEKSTGGRERFYIRETIGGPIDMWQDILPTGTVLSYKNHLRGLPLPTETSVVSFHDGGTVGGASRPHKLLDTVPWLKDHWR